LRGRPGFGATEGLYATALIGLLLAYTLDLNGVAAVCSTILIIIYIAVIAAHCRLRRITRGNIAVILTSLAVVAAILVLLLYNQYQTSPRSFYAILVSYAARY
jgi:low affinity Fe/Cu permease